MTRLERAIILSMQFGDWADLIWSTLVHTGFASKDTETKKGVAQVNLALGRLARKGLVVRKDSVYSSQRGFRSGSWNLTHEGKALRHQLLSCIDEGSR